MIPFGSVRNRSYSIFSWEGNETGLYVENGAVGALKILSWKE